MPLPESFTIGVFDAVKCVGFIGSEFRTFDLPRATQWYTRESAEDLAAALKEDVAEGLTLTVCDQNGWPILDTIDIPIEDLSASQPTKGGNA